MSGEEFRAWRKSQRLSQSAAAILAGVASMTIYRWEKMATIPKKGEWFITLVNQELLKNPPARMDT